MMGDNINPGASTSAAMAGTADSLSVMGPASFSTSLAPVVSSLGSSLGTVNTDVPVMDSSTTLLATTNSGDNWTYGSRYATGFDGTVYMVGPNLPPAAYTPMIGGAPTGSSSPPASSPGTGTTTTPGGATAGLGGSGAVTGSGGTATGDPSSMVNLLLQLLMQLLTLLLQQMSSGSGGQDPVTPEDPETPDDPQSPREGHETHGHTHEHHRPAGHEAMGSVAVRAR
jgi:hypothetical protein